MDWELTKENCVPVRQGRSKAALQEMADPALDVLEAKRRELWSAITEYKGDDPLEPWQRYIKWMQEYGIGGGKADMMKVLEACTRELQKYPRYANDIRFLRIWIQYADCLPDPDDVFLFLKEKGIGRDFALYYEAYATYFELKGNFQAADAVYMDGIQRGVKQLDRLKQKHTAFQQRMAQRIQRRIQDEHVMGSPPEDPVRASLASIGPRGSGRGHLGQQQQQRRQNAASIFGVAGASQQPMGSFGLRPNPLQQERGRRPIIGLREDDEFAGNENPRPGPLGYSVMPQVENVRELQPYGVRRKENLDRALAWNQAPLVPGAASTAAGTPAGAPTGVEIFTDEEFQDGDGDLSAKAGRSGQTQDGWPSAGASQSLDQSLMLTNRSAPGSASGGADALMFSLMPPRTLLHGVPPRSMHSVPESFASLSLSGSSAAVPPHAPLGALSAAAGRLTKAPDGAAFGRAGHVIAPGAMPVGTYAQAPALALAASAEKADCVQQSGDEEMSYEERRAVAWSRRNPASRYDAIPAAGVGKAAEVGSISTTFLSGSDDAENGDGASLTYSTGLGDGDVIVTAPRRAPFGQLIPTVATRTGTEMPGQTLQNASSNVQVQESQQGAPSGGQQRRPLADATPIARAPLGPPASSLTCPGPPAARTVGFQAEPPLLSTSCVSNAIRSDDRKHDDAQPTVTISTRGAFDLINSLFSEDLPHQQLSADRGPPRPSSVSAVPPPSLAPLAEAIRPPCPKPQAALSSSFSAPKQPPATEPTVTLHTKQAFDALNDMFCDTLPHEEARKLGPRGAAASNGGVKGGANHLKPISTSDVCRLANAARGSAAGALGAGPRDPDCLAAAGGGGFGRACSGGFETNPVIARPYAEAAPGLIIHEDTFLGPAQPSLSGSTLGVSAGVSARAASAGPLAQDAANHQEPAAIYEDTEFIPRGGDLPGCSSGSAVPPGPRFILEDTEFVTRHHEPKLAASGIRSFDRSTTNAHGGSRAGLASRPVLGGRPGAREMCATITGSKSASSGFQSRHNSKNSFLQIYEDTQYNLDE